MRRDRVGAVDGRGAAAHPAVGPDLHGLGGQPPGVPALQALAEQPVHLVVHDQAVDPLVQRPGLVRRGERGERVTPQVRVAGRGDAERGQVLAGPLHQAAPLGGAHPGDVLPQVPLEHREHGALEDHPVEAAVGIPAERAARRIRLIVREPGRSQRRAVEHAGVQRRVVQHRRAVRDRLIQVGPAGVAALAELVLHVPAAGHPRARRGGGARRPQPGLDGRDVGGSLRAAVGARREIAHVGDVAVRIDQPGNDGGPVQPGHLRDRAGRRPDLRRVADRGDPAVPDQHGPGGPAAGHRDDDGILDNQVHGWNPTSRRGAPARACLSLVLPGAAGPTSHTGHSRPRFPRNVRQNGQKSLKNARPAGNVTAAPD